MNCIWPECGLLLLFHSCFFIKGTLTHNHGGEDWLVPGRLEPFKASHYQSNVGFCPGIVDFLLLENSGGSLLIFAISRGKKKVLFCRMIKIKELLRGQTSTSQSHLIGSMSSHLQRASDRQVCLSSRQLGLCLSWWEQEGTMVRRRRSAHAWSGQEQKSRG